MIIKCVTCKKEFFIKPSKLGKRSHCSQKCLFADPEWRKKLSKALTGIKRPALSESQKGNKNSNWKGGKTKVRGYIKIIVYDHPNRSVNNYVLEHRLVMERHLKRYLNSWELVHHKNGIRDDNRLKNLEILTYKSHHGKVTCPFCEKSFLIK